MDKKLLKQFIIDARENTYAGGKGKTEPLLPGSTQMEYGQNDLLYRDLYNIGNGIFMGIETVYQNGKPIWSMSYFGDFKKVSEAEIDKILIATLSDYANKTRFWESVEVSKENYLYRYTVDYGNDLDEFSGNEEILKNGKKVYSFLCAGGYIG